MNKKCEHYLFPWDIDKNSYQYLMSYRANGKMNVKPLNIRSDGIEDRDAATDQNRSRFYGAHGLGRAQRVEPYLQHGDEVMVVTSRDEALLHPRVDAVVCASKDLLIGMTSADCPICFLEADGMVAGLHSGHLGTALNITAKTIRTMCDLGAKVEDIKLFVGPHIGAGELLCYEIQEDVASRFKDYLQCCTPKPDGGYYLRLGEIIRGQALGAGLLSRNIKVSEECTLCNPEKFFSWRYEQKLGHPLRVMLTAICMTS